MTRVEVVNRQSIDGKEYKRGQTVELSNGRARDLIIAGKVRAVAEAPATPQTATTAVETKGGK